MLYCLSLVASFVASAIQERRKWNRTTEIRMWHKFLDVTESLNLYLELEKREMFKNISVVEDKVLPSSKILKQNISIWELLRSFEIFFPSPLMIFLFLTTQTPPKGTSKWKSLPKRLERKLITGVCISNESQKCYLINSLVDNFIHEYP